MVFNLRRAPFVMKPDGQVDHALLQYLASHFKETWVPLADSLNVRRIGIRHSSNDALEVLIRWVKRMPRSSNKV